MPGILFVVATPIGNLEDLTFRALRTLREVDLIAAEDTRRTAKLLAHYEIRKSLISLREHNEAKQSARLVTDLEGGKQIALVTDSGTPGIADPGARFVRLARQRHIKVVPIPGCSAITTALSASGLEAERFTFAGFAPPGARVDNWLYDLKRHSDPVVFFETPHSIVNTINRIEHILVKRPIVVWRELTKIHEESVEIGPAAPPVQVTPKGEFVIVVGSQDNHQADAGSVGASASAVTSLFDYLTKYPGLDETSVLTMIASRYEMRPSDVRKAIKKHKILVKQQNSKSD